MRRHYPIEGLNPDFVHQFHAANPADWISFDQERSLSGHLARQLTSQSLPDLLRYEDRNSMAFGIEARVPFLDDRLVDFCFRDAAPYRIHSGWTKWILRQAMSDILPAEIAWRTDKVGFETPERVWVRHVLEHTPALSPGDEACRYLDPSFRSTSHHPAPSLDAIRRAWRRINIRTWLEVWSSAPPLSSPHEHSPSQASR